MGMTGPPSTPARTRGHVVGFENPDFIVEDLRGFGRALR